MLYEFDQQHLSSIGAHVVLQDTDEHLMTRIQALDSGALAVLFQRHKQLLRRTLARILNNDSDVDDVLQDICIEVWRQADRYNETKGKTLGWIMKIARCRAIDKLRKRQSFARVEERLRDEMDDVIEPAMQHGADAEASATDTADVFRRLIAALPRAQQQALQLAFFRGLSQREIAAQTGIPLGTVKTRLELAIRKLRKSITALGGAREWSAAGC